MSIRDDYYLHLHGSGDHYDRMIWVVFGGGVALSLWILYAHWLGNELPRTADFVMLLLGVIVLIYSFLLFLSFNQKKEFFYKKHNEYFRKKNFHTLTIYDHIRVRYIGEFILVFIFLIYVVTFAMEFLPWFSLFNFMLILLTELSEVF